MPMRSSPPHPSPLPPRGRGGKGADRGSLKYRAGKKEPIEGFFNPEFDSIFQVGVTRKDHAIKSPLPLGEG
ncbi:hypothetical protein EMIT0232MI5_110184 [Pseudomonas sp. IT-232MI5]